MTSESITTVESFRRSQQQEKQSSGKKQENSNFEDFVLKEQCNLFNKTTPLNLELTEEVQSFNPSSSSNESIKQTKKKKKQYKIVQLKGNEHLQEDEDKENQCENIQNYEYIRDKKSSSQIRKEQFWLDDITNKSENQSESIICKTDISISSYQDLDSSIFLQHKNNNSKRVNFNESVKQYKVTNWKKYNKLDSEEAKLRKKRLDELEKKCACQCSIF